MKIVITGTFSTGKTTLIKEFVSRNENIKFKILKEKATQLIELGIPFGKKATLDSYTRYINEQLKSEIESNKDDYEILLSDRSLIDGVTHPIINNRIGVSNLPNHFIEMFENVLHFQKSFYDIYIYIPIEFDLITDNKRENDKRYQKELDEEIVKMLDKHIVNYYTLFGTIEERCLKLSKIIKEEIIKHNNGYK